MATYKSAAKSELVNKINTVFDSMTWKEISQRLHGENPIIFIIVKRGIANKIEDIYIKGGKFVENLGPLDIKNSLIAENETRRQAAEKKRIEEEIGTTVTRDIDAVFLGQAKIEPVEEEIKKIVEAKAKEPAPQEESVEVDLKVGMKIIYKDMGARVMAEILSVDDENNELIIRNERKEVKVIPLVKILSLA